MHLSAYNESTELDRLPRLARVVTYLGEHCPDAIPLIAGLDDTRAP